MKFAYRNREFWCKGYYVDTEGENTYAIKNYISNQLKSDKEADQLSLFDPRDPFMGSKFIAWLSGPYTATCGLLIILGFYPKL